MLLFVYSCSCLMLDCQRVQRQLALQPHSDDEAAAAAVGLQPADIGMFGVRFFPHHLFAVPAESSRPRGLSEVEIERVGRIATFAPRDRGEGKQKEEEGEQAKEQQGLQPEGAAEEAVEAKEESMARERRALLVQDSAPAEPPAAAALADVDVPQCVVCLETLRAGDQVLVLPCMHMFHPLCIRPWLRHSQACPSQRSSHAPPAARVRPQQTDGSASAMDCVQCAATQPCERPLPLQSPPDRDGCLSCIAVLWHRLSNAARRQQSKGLCSLRTRLRISRSP